MYKTFDLSEIALMQTSTINEIVKEDISPEAMIQKILGVMAFAEKIVKEYDET